MLQPSLMDEARRVAKAEGVAVKQLINVAVAEKVYAITYGGVSPIYFRRLPDRRIFVKFLLRLRDRI